MARGILHVFCTKNIKGLIIIALLFTLGCSFTELRKVLFRLNVRDVAKAEKENSKIFDIDSSSCFNAVLEILEEMNISILYQNIKKYFIVAYGFNELFPCLYSTEVGMLIEPLRSNQTEIKVASDNSKLARFVSAELFEKLEEMKKKRRGR